jgi:hypothetical protein
MSKQSGKYDLRVPRIIAYIEECSRNIDGSWGLILAVIFYEIIVALSNTLTGFNRFSKRPCF